MFEEMIEKLHSGEWLSLETSPAKSAVFQPIVDKLAALGLDKKVGGWIVTDNPLAQLRYGSLFAAIKLQAAFNKPAIATISMRDRNLIGIQSDILGANEAGVRAFLSVTGDPASLSDQPRAKGVFEANSVEFLKVAHFFNRGIDYAGKTIAPPPKRIYPFAATNSYAKNAIGLKRKIARKIAAGALGVISQPVFSIDDARYLQTLFDEARSEFDDDRKNAKLILGVFPLARLKTAQFLHSRVPGIRVSARWIDALFAANRGGEEEEEKVGYEMSAELLRSIRKANLPVHIMSANKFDLAAKLIDHAT
ncbi:MAG: methylenetetrahydrofolate reductase [Helicobacteraceae bacterium]|jgi:5,10-methylenetetrahydrofolate reductase|nr:methylenetetrahydrofolate reductase [Helicobacteraceae bacterium]